MRKTAAAIPTKPAKSRAPSPAKQPGTKRPVATAKQTAANKRPITVLKPAAATAGYDASDDPSPLVLDHILEDSGRTSTINNYDTDSDDSLPSPKKKTPAANLPPPTDSGDTKMSAKSRRTTPQFYAHDPRYATHFPPHKQHRRATKPRPTNADNTAFQGSERVGDETPEDIDIEGFYAFDALLDKQEDSDEPDETWYLVKWLHKVPGFASLEWVFESKLDSASCDSAKLLLDRYLALPEERRNTTSLLMWRRNQPEWLMMCANSDSSCLAAICQACHLLGMDFFFDAEDILDFKISRDIAPTTAIPQAKLKDFILYLVQHYFLKIDLQIAAINQGTPSKTGVIHDVVKASEEPGVYILITEESDTCHAWAFHRHEDTSVYLYDGPDEVDIQDTFTRPAGHRRILFQRLIRFQPIMARRTEESDTCDAWAFHQHEDSSVYLYDGMDEVDIADTFTRPAGHRRIVFQRLIRFQSTIARQFPFQESKKAAKQARK
ncbi:hypothetical protein DYB35_005285 [Aphanomyces astaci]|uniref:Chromo domain-containing protein n=2 Tax=Aphanomyces astaci TaxID=112090 RepID=A0A418DDK2_APHAT|nr:hypothetical protein DYB35_005285 [Aphanomyces astaci]RHZ25858.1 hypothetical protein DYB26_007781 [Aphanomyces astaci]